MNDFISRSICISGIVMLTISVILCFKNKTGKSVAQIIWMILGEIFCWVGVFLILQ